jgi:hypothetical protein
LYFLADLYGNIWYRFFNTAVFNVSKYYHYIDQPHEEMVKSVLKNEANETDRNNSILYTCYDEMMYQQLLLDHPNAENVKMVLKDENESLETLKVTIEQQIVEVANLGEATEKLTRDLEIHHTAETNAEAAAALEEKLREAAKVKDVKEKETKPNDLLNYKGGAQHNYPYHCNDCTRQFEQLRFFNVHLTTTGHTGRPMPSCNPNPNPNPNPDPDPTGHTGRPPCKETIDDKTKGLEAGATITPIGYCSLLQYKRPTHNRSYRITQHKMKSLEELNTVIFKALNTVPEVVPNKGKPTEKNISCKIGTQKAKIAAAVTTTTKTTIATTTAAAATAITTTTKTTTITTTTTTTTTRESPPVIIQSVKAITTPVIPITGCIIGYKCEDCEFSTKNFKLLFNHVESSGHCCHKTRGEVYMLYFS